MCSAQLRSREMFISLTHAPGEAHTDFGEALVVVAAVVQKGHSFVASVNMGNRLAKLAWSRHSEE